MNDACTVEKEATELERAANNIATLAERVGAVRERVYRVVGDVSGSHSVKPDTTEAPPSNGRLNALKDAIAEVEGALCELEDGATALESLNL